MGAMREKDTITVYWSPSVMVDKIALNLLFPKPISLASKLHGEKIPGSKMLQCPANRDTMRNIFVMYAGMDDIVNIPEGRLEEMNNSENFTELIDNSSIVELRKNRASSFPGYTNVLYNLQWLVFADEPVNMRLTAPWYPAQSPCEGALFSFGQMDVGQWFRTMNLDYHIPHGTKKFEVKQGDALCYMEFMTDKKIVFKRFNLTPELYNIAEELGQVSIRYNQNQTIQSRYDMAERSGIRDLVLHHIRNNVVESADMVYKGQNDTVFDQSNFVADNTVENLEEAKCPFPHGVE